VSPGAIQGAHEELARARGSLREARTLLESQLLDGAVSRLYYAALHATRAALAVRGLYAKTHSGNAKLFRGTFGPHPILERVLQLRADADYGAGVTESADNLSAITADVVKLVSYCETVVAEAEARGPDEPDPPPDL
jgi:uncharacterized protein (UPF0332 family)